MGNVDNNCWLWENSSRKYGSLYTAKISRFLYTFAHVKMLILRSQDWHIFVKIYSIDISVQSAIFLLDKRAKIRL